MKTKEQLSEALNVVIINNYDFDFISDRVLKLAQNLNFDFLTRTFNTSFYEGLVEVRNNSRKAIKKAKNFFSNSDIDFNRIIKSLNDLTSEELNELFKEYNAEKGNEKILYLLQIFIIKKEAIEWLANFLKNDSIYIFFKSKEIVFKRNFRFFFRKILSTHFKNLDDYHSFSIL